MRRLQPALQSSQGQSGPWSGARLINCFAERADGDRVEDFAVMAIPGLSLFSGIDGLPIRGAVSVGGALYVVAGSTLYSISATGAETPLGTVMGNLPVRMAGNGAQVAIATGADTNIGYVYNPATATVSTPLNLPAVTDCAFIDGYIVWTVAFSDQFLISALDDATVYDPLDVATVEGAPDNLVGLVNDHRELLMFGEETIEVWYSSGAVDFPFERQGNAFIERGCRDRDSIVKIDNGVHFVGNDLIVYRLEGYSPRRISTHAIEASIASAQWFRAFEYSLEGHSFYCLNTDVGTFCFDMATGAWHNRQSYGMDNYRVGFSVEVFDRVIFGDATTGNLYLPSMDEFRENGNPVVVVIELPTITAARTRQTLYSIELYCETGVGNAASANPLAMLTYSRDGGRMFSNELVRPLGRVGEYLTRAIWRLNVEFRQLKLRFAISDPVRRLVMGYYADIR